MCVEVEAYTGKFSGPRGFIPRRPLQPSDTDLPLASVRYQSPLRPFCAISMNKSHGETLLRALPHGQLYVALSRARRKSDIHVALPFTADRPRAQCRIPGAFAVNHATRIIRYANASPVLYLFLRRQKAPPELFARISIGTSPPPLIVPQISVTSQIIPKIGIPRASSGDYKRVAY